MSVYDITQQTECIYFVPILSQNTVSFVAEYHT